MDSENITGLYPILAAFFAAFVSVLWLHPKMVQIALLKNITDNPGRRKLQREPVPVLGGVAVFFGIVIGAFVAVPFLDAAGLAVVFALMTLMLYTGTMDDIMGLTPRLRFLIEAVSVIAAMAVGGYEITSFHGLWGVWGIPAWAGIPLTMVAAVGIINAINLIDGVDGLSSGYCIAACIIFSIWFFLTGDMLMTVLAVSCVGALIPFFAHNVFGRQSKMFIGDGGTLVMGMLMALFVLRVLGSGAVSSDSERHLGLVPFVLAVLSIPVFDTVRVMTMRIVRGTSPFNPDKTHLHHGILTLGLSHIGTTCCIIALNLAVTGVWFLLYRLGCSVDVQFYVVVALSLLFTAALYKSIRIITVRRGLTGES